MRPRVAVSACLAGHAVRWDGAHKHHHRIALLGRVAEIVTVCPEMDLGLGTPREAIDITPDGRLVGVTSGADHTERMLALASQRARELDVGGYVFKARSPSCGLARGGIFATEFLRLVPGLPAVEESTLDDSDAFEAFVRAVSDRAGRARRPPR